MVSELTTTETSLLCAKASAAKDAAKEIEARMLMVMVVGC